MANYKKMYILLFRATECAVRLLEKGDLYNAVLALKLAQLQCENYYLDTEA